MQRIAVGTRKGLLLFEEQSGDWTMVNESHRGVPVTYAMRDPRSGVLFACLAHGHWGCKMQRSEDEGATWEEIESPTYPEGAEITHDKPAVLKYQWCLAHGGDDQDGRLYLGTVPGGLFVSDDHGRTFQLNDSLWNHPTRMEQWFGGGMDEPGIHSVVVDPRNADHLYVGISCAGVFASRDGGQTWEVRNRGLRADFLPDPNAEIGHDPHLLVQCRSRPDVLWQQNHCGIFRTTDAGGQWEECRDEDGPAGFGFAVAVDPEDGDIGWVVPAESDMVRVAVDHRLCVSRTEDGGKTWTAFREGLPQEHCYDFAFRHGLDLAGNRLAFGTACGSLYVSDDRGESWRAISYHLPPVYSVRFM